MAQGGRRSLLVREVWGWNPYRIRSPTRCQRFATAAILKCGLCWCKAAEMAPLTRDTLKDIKRV